MNKSITATYPAPSRSFTGGKAILLALLCVVSFGAAAHGSSDRSGIDRYSVDLQFSGGERLSLQSGPGYGYRHYSGYPSRYYYPPAYGRHWDKHGHKSYRHDDRGHHHKSWSNGHDKHRYDSKRYYTNNWNKPGKGHDRHDGNRFHDGGRH